LTCSFAGHEASTPPQPRDEVTAQNLAATGGLYCPVHRFARAAMLLAGDGMGREGVVLNPVMLEHTIVLHRIIARGDDGIDAMLANRSRQMKKWLERTRGTALDVPLEITASLDGIDETKAAGIFSKICRQVDCDDLYVGSTGSGARQSTRRRPRATPT
jgi:hypothetical protein